MKRFLTIFGICLPVVLVAMNFSVVNMAMSTIQQEFDASVQELQWILNALGIATSVFLVAMGRLADIHGRRRIFILGTFLVGLASLGAGLAPSPAWIIAMQAVMGIACAIILPVSQALIACEYPENKRSHAIGLWASIAGLALGIGPIVGGTIIDFWGWRWIFFVNVPLAALALIFSMSFVRESKSKKDNAKVDFHGMVLLTLSIGALVLSIMQAPEWGWRSYKLMGLWAFFAAITYLFIRSERNSPFPTIQPQFFFKRRFVLSSLGGFCIVFFGWANFFLLPLFLQKEYGLDAFWLGLVMLLASGPVFVFSSLVGKLYRMTGPKPLMAAGFAIFALSALIQINLSAANFWLVLLAVLLFGLGWVLAWSPSITAATSSVPRDSAALASGAFVTIQEIGGTLGLTITGTVFRVGTDFMHGYSNGAWVLFAAACVGFISSVSLRKN